MKQQVQQYRTQSLEAIPPANQQFFNDVVAGLSSSPKKLNSKYFYDDRGDELFKKIMQLPEYYLTRSELEILQYQSGFIVSKIASLIPEFDVVELGAGDASKSYFLLKELQRQGLDFTYYPIDISAGIIAHLEDSLPAKLPGLDIVGLNGEYLDMIRKSKAHSDRPKLFMFMGSNIGNFVRSEALDFCRQLQKLLTPDDLLMLGFDLKKNPRTILDAYNDASGTTKEFNLNLLRRINRELQANFRLENFEHYATYDPITGICKSYLVSLCEQMVRIGDELVVFFSENEVIDMEISMKYSIEEVSKLANDSGFKPVMQYYDSRKWFVDILWRVAD